ncbi:hypothetical protein [Actinoplanes subglobosus]|uniref:Uncharacterized protein n=1 Tax=Actinoplanes subglobosus TaxID=1547892 RepID=A0ABV8JCN7_9ACTN
MTRVELLRELRDNGRRLTTSRLEKCAGELDLPLADVLVVAGHAVPGHLLPPNRDLNVLRAFAYRVTYCSHTQLAELQRFVSALPNKGAPPEPRPARSQADHDPFPAVLQGLMGNRGLGLRELPFVGLSLSTIRGMLGGAWHRLPQLQAVSGPLGWRTADLAVLAGEPMHPLDHGPILCRHYGAVYLAAVHCITAQVVRAARKADQLSARKDHGAWQPVSHGIDECPDARETSKEPSTG